VTTSPSISPTPDPKRWLAFAVILSATLLGVLDFLIVNLALPSIKKTIGATDAQVQLTVAVYGLAFAVCLITGGRLGDIYGRKRIFQIGMGGFTLASTLCGFAQTPAQLIGFRIVQGAFAALMSPQVLATIQVTFAGAERDKATGAPFFLSTCRLASRPLLLRFTWCANRKRSGRKNWMSRAH
jgi:MFS family permease